ncbi:MAG: hypothetical protein GY719_27570 [bacterium]|nr:hypothetical protein [bacterium]
MPAGLAASGDDLWATDAALGTLLKIHDGSGVVTPPPPLVPPIWLFNGIAVGVRGDAYVTGDVDNVVYKIRRLD